MEKNKKYLLYFLIIVLFTVVLFYIIDNNSNLKNDFMIKHSDDTILYIPDFNYLDFNKVKKDVEYILIISNCISTDVREAKEIVKVTDTNKIKSCTNLFNLTKKKKFAEDDVVDFTINHIAIFFRINSEHYFRIDLFDDYYSIIQDNLIASRKCYVYDENKEKVTNIIEKWNK